MARSRNKTTLLRPRISSKDLGCFFLLLLIPLTGYSQEEIDNQLWLDYNLRYDLTDRSSIGGDAGIRGAFTNYDWNQIVFRPQYMYRARTTFGMNAGAGYFGTFFEDTLNLHEFRPNFDLLFRFPDNEYIAFFYRLRLEPRFFFYEQGSNDQNLRVRYLIGVESPDIFIGGQKRPIYFQAFWEGFNTLFEESAAEVFVNQTRITFIFAHRVSRYFRYEFNFVLQRSRLFSESGLQTGQQLFRFRFFHRVFQRQATEVPVD